MSIDGVPRSSAPSKYLNRFCDGEGSADSIGSSMMLCPAGAGHKVDESSSAKGIVISDNFHYPSESSEMITAKPEPATNS